MNVRELPQWALENKIDFVHATPGIKALAKADGFAPRWFAMQGGSDTRIIICWNAQRAEKYYGRDIPDHLR